MRADVDDVRDFEVAADVPEIVSQMFDRGAPADMIWGLSGQRPGTGSVPIGAEMTGGFHSLLRLKYDRESAADRRHFLSRQKRAALTIA